MTTYPVSVDLTHLDRRHIDIFLAYTRIWLRKHCHDEWEVQLLDNHTLLVVFQNPKEAVYFKLSSLFDMYQRPTLIHILNSPM
jgi:hypothetical protein